MSHSSGSGAEFQPYVSADRSRRPSSRSRRSSSGAFFGILFGAATVYLALRAGLTVSASIPIAVLAIAVFKKLGKSTILENNIVQTIGSAGESVAGGRRLHHPGAALPVGRRRVLQATRRSSCSRRRRDPRRALHDPAAPRADRQGARQPARTRKASRAPTCSSPARGAATWRGWSSRASARRCSTSSCTGSSASGTRPRPGSARAATGKIPDATLASDVTPEYLGLGYIIGPRIAGELASGGVLSWLVLIPLISIFVPESAPRPGPEEPRLHGRLDGRPLPRRVDLPRVHPLHRRGRGRLRRRHDADQDAADDRLGVPRVREVASEGRRGGPRHASAPSDDLGMGIVVFGSLVLALIDHRPPEVPARPLPGLAR